MPARPDDEDPVDQRKHYEEICHPKCKSQWDQYQACAARVAKLPEGSEANVRALIRSSDTRHIVCDSCSYTLGIFETHRSFPSQCAGTYNDYWHCSDKCVSLFPRNLNTTLFPAGFPPQC